jgi:molybdopterin-guanine dinucleotide biosynthesis protein A
MTPSPTSPPFAAAVLAGGESSRFGRDKAFARWKGRRLLDRQLDLLRGLGPAQLLISGRPEADYAAAGATVVLDAVPGLGPLGGRAALLGASPAPQERKLAVDLPAMTRGFLQSLLTRRAPGVGVVPRLRLAGRPGWEPLAAVYPREILPVVRRHLARRELALHRLVQAGVVAGLLVECPVPAASRAAFRNVNTPADLADAPRPGLSRHT